MLYVIFIIVYCDLALCVLYELEARFGLKLDVLSLVLRDDYVCYRQL